MKKDMRAYIDSLEAAGEKHTATEWREIIEAEIEDLRSQGAPEENLDIDIEDVLFELELDDYITIFYIVVEEKGADVFTKSFTSQEEAINKANGEWDHLTNYEKERCKAFYVLKTEDPDSMDGDIIKDLKKQVVRYWLDTEYNYGDFSVPKWALHKVTDDGCSEEEDEIILWRAYEDTPGYPESTDPEAIDDYIQDELGFLPEYEVN
jgi:hypothetical protein